MAWRAQISDRPIWRLAILSSKPGILAAWTAADRVVFLDLASGGRVSDVTFTSPAKLEPFDIRSSKPATTPAPALDKKPETSLSSDRSNEKKPASPTDELDTLDFDLKVQSNTASKPELIFEPPRDLFLRHAFEMMRAPNGDYLPSIRLKTATIHTTANGIARVCRVGDEWLFDMGNEWSFIEKVGDRKIAAFGIDRAEGITALLDTQGRLHIYRGGSRIGDFETPLKLQDDLQSEIALADGGDVIAVSDGQRIAMLDLTGKVLKTLHLHYSLGAFALSSDGKTLITGDLDASVIRAYGGKDWTPTVQRFAVDLLADARRAQLIGTAATTGAALGPIALGVKGTLAFAMVGTVCVTTISRMKPTPPPKPPLRDGQRIEITEPVAKEEKVKSTK